MLKACDVPPSAASKACSNKEITDIYEIHRVIESTSVCAGVRAKTPNSSRNSSDDSSTECLRKMTAGLLYLASANQNHEKSMR